MKRTITVDDIARALHQPLPGYEAQMRMATRPRSSAKEFGERGMPRHGAVLLLLYPLGEQLFFPLTRRTERVAHHKGQIALPGGAQEAADISLWQTALRETQEEIGVPAADVVQLGAMSSLYIAPSHFVVHPFVGSVAARPAFHPDPVEVAELIEAPLMHLLDATAKEVQHWMLHDRPTEVPCYRYRGHVIWGATAMILSEMEAVLRQLLEER